MNPREPEALLFDLGGVLIDIDFDRVLRRWADLAGAPVDALRVRFDHGTAYQRHERGEIDAAGYYAALRESLAIDLDDAQFEDGWNQVFGPEIAPTVALLEPLSQRIPLHLFSNTNQAHFRHWRPRYDGALRHFGRVFTSFEIGLRKPEAASFAHVAREIGVPLERIVFFDDTLANVEGARAVNLPSVHVRSPADVRAAVSRFLDGAAAGSPPAA